MSGGPSELEELIRSFLFRFSRRVRLERVFLFGSTARGDRLEGSDVDLVLVSPDFEGMPLNERFRILYSLWPPDLDGDLIPLTPGEFEGAGRRSIALRDAQEYWLELTPPAEGEEKEGKEEKEEKGKLIGENQT